MKVKSHLFSPASNIDSGIAALLGFLLIQFFAKHSGIGISPDSVTYITSARHVIQGVGIRSFDGLPTVDFPVAYPLFLTIISFFTGLDPLQFGPVVNGLLFGLLIYTCGAIMNGFENAGSWYKRVILLCILLSPALQEVYSMLWSETIFLLLILFFIIGFSKYLKSPDRKWFFISISIAAVICITRYAGAFILLAAIAAIFLNKNSTGHRKLNDLLLFGALSIFPLLFNLLRNQWLSGTATGPRPYNTSGFSTTLANFGTVVSDWLLLEKSAVSGIALALILPCIFLAGVIFHHRYRKNSFEYLIALTGLVYCLFMLVTSTLTRYEAFSNRLLSPLFMLLLWTVSSWIPGLIRRYSGRVRLFAVITVLIISSWFINIQLRADYEYYDGVKDAGIPGYQEDEIRKSEIVLWLERNKTVFVPGSLIYSNAGDAVYFFTGLTARQLLFIEFPLKVQTFYQQENPAGQPEYLVWFRDLDNPEMPTLVSIQQNKKMTLLKQLADGAVFIMK